VAAAHVNGARATALLYALDDFARTDINRLLPEIGEWPPADNQMIIERSSLVYAGASVGPAVNLHDSVCGRHRSHPADEDADVGDIGSALGPPITTMPPVVVYTGETDPGMVAKAAVSMGVSVDATQIVLGSSFPFERLFSQPVIAFWRDIT